jgi:hypothetical protein
MEMERRSSLKIIETGEHAMAYAESHAHSEQVVKDRVGYRKGEVVRNALSTSSACIRAPSQVKVFLLGEKVAHIGMLVDELCTNSDTESMLPTLHERFTSDVLIRI